MSDLPFRGSDDWLEPPGPSARLPGTTQLPAGYTNLGGGVVWAGPNVPMTPEQAQKEAFALTGIPNIQGALGALGRKEYLPAFGQGMWGALQMAGLIAPAARVAEGLPLLEALEDVRGGPTAYHGTGAPAFDRFSNDFIGTGEGAQAYGWGHYVAGNPSVAEQYRIGLAGKRPVPADENGNPLSYADTVRKFYEPGTIVPGYGGQFNKVLAFHEGNPEQGGAGWSVDVQQVVPKKDAQFKNLGEAIQNPDMWEPSLSYGYKRNHSTYPDEKDLADVGQVKGWPMVKPGSLLEVKVLPEEHELLDWDKQLKDQPEGVQQALRNVADKYLLGSMYPEKRDAIWENYQNSTGQELYKTFAGQRPVAADVSDALKRSVRGDEATSHVLHEAGIPGIRYLDRGSRNNVQEQMLQEQLRAGLITQEEYNAKSQATRNYVIFDPSNLQITARNGQKLEPVDHDPFKGGQ